MKIKALVGYTGFVGSNINASVNFEAVYNSKNIRDAYGTKPDLLIYSGLRAEKFLANKDPEKDMETIIEAEQNIKQIAPKKLVLISTVDVFKHPVGVDENSVIDTEGLHPYGLNRYILEQWVREHFEDALIIRLPGLFGKNLKKNFIYDMINIVPSMLKSDKFLELASKDPFISDYYEISTNGFYVLKNNGKENKELKEHFISLNFTALNFTDSRSVFQFYPLDRFWSDIKIALDNELLLWHPATEPIEASELYFALTSEKFSNMGSGVPLKYDYRTCYAELFNGENGYIIKKSDILRKLTEFYLNEKDY